MAVIGDVAATVAKFVARWVQSPSGHDFLVASTIPSDWARLHMPVISKGGTHSLYTKYHQMEPNGQLVKCHRMCCGGMRLDSRSKTLRIICSTCNSRCPIPRVQLDPAKPLGHKYLIKTEFPRVLFPTQWECGPLTGPEKPLQPPPDPSPILTATVQPSPSKTEVAPLTSMSRTMPMPVRHLPTVPVYPNAIDEVSHMTFLPTFSGPSFGLPYPSLPIPTTQVPAWNLTATIPCTSSTPSLGDFSTPQPSEVPPRRKAGTQDSHSGHKKKQKRQ